MFDAAHICYYVLIVFGPCFGWWLARRKYRRATRQPRNRRWSMNADIEAARAQYFMNKFLNHRVDMIAKITALGPPPSPPTWRQRLRRIFR